MALFDHVRKNVFFSYSRKDSLPLIEKLQGFILGVFTMHADKITLVPGTSWERQLENLIQKCDVFVFIISPNSVDAFAENSHQPVCSWEVNCALKNRTYILPVVWEKPNNMELLPEELHKLHWVDFEPYRLSGMKDENLFGLAFDRFRLGINGHEDEWLDESLLWIDKMRNWINSEYDSDFLLTEDEMNSFELLLKRTPPNCLHIMDFAQMNKFIRVNRKKWNPPNQSVRH